MNFKKHKETRTEDKEVDTRYIMCMIAIMGAVFMLLYILFSWVLTDDAKTSSKKKTSEVVSSADIPNERLTRFTDGTYTSVEFEASDFDYIGNEYVESAEEAYTKNMVFPYTTFKGVQNMEKVLTVDFGLEASSLDIEQSKKFDLVNSKALGNKVKYSHVLNGKGEDNQISYESSITTDGRVGGYVTEYKFTLSTFDWDTNDAIVKTILDNFSITDSVKDKLEVSMCSENIKIAYDDNNCTYITVTRTCNSDNCVTYMSFSTQLNGAEEREVTELSEYNNLNNLVGTLNTMPGDISNYNYESGENLVIDEIVHNIFEYYGYEIAYDVTDATFKGSKLTGDVISDESADYTRTIENSDKTFKVVVNTEYELEAASYGLTIQYVDDNEDADTDTVETAVEESEEVNNTDESTVSGKTFTAEQIEKNKMFMYDFTLLMNNMEPMIDTEQDLSISETAEDRVMSKSLQYTAKNGNNYTLSYYFDNNFCGLDIANYSVEFPKRDSDMWKY